MYKQQGFTLLELMVVIAIIGIITSFAIPSYQNLQRSSAVRNVNTIWQNSFYFTQAEAMRLKRPMVLCPSENGTTCTNVGYEKGWIVLDETENRIIRDELPPKVQGLSISFNGNSNNKLEILPNGNIKGFQGRTLKSQIIQNDKVLVSKMLVISREGRIRFSDDPNADDSKN